jgi:hypothetical protein
MIIIIRRGKNFVAHLDGLGGTLVNRGTPVAHHCSTLPHYIEEGINTRLTLKSR